VERRHLNSHRFFPLLLDRLCLVVLIVVAAAVVSCGPARAQQEARIAAVVNGEPISFMDLMNRTRLVIYGAGLALTDENVNRLMPQILNGLIDEELQRQEAKAQNVTIREQEVDNALASMEQRNNMPPGALDEFLASKGIDKGTLISQVRSSILWAKLVDRRLRPQVQIGDEEIDEALRRIEENQNEPQILVSDIFLAADDSSTDSRVRESALRIVQQIRSGASFAALARALSQNATAASGGDLGWLGESQFDGEIGRALVTMQPGQVAGPIRTPDGYHIVLLRERRIAGGADASKTTVDLRQIGFPLPPEPTKEEIAAVLAAASEIRNGVSDCVALEGSRLPGNAKVTRIGRIRVADLAQPMQTPVMRLGPNQISAPLRTRQGIVLLMVCEREAEAVELPSRDQIRGRLELERLDLLARRYLRDLRRAAFLDIRI